MCGGVTLFELQDTKSVILSCICFQITSKIEMVNSEMVFAVQMWAWWAKELSLVEHCLELAICSWSYSGMCGCDRGTEQGRENRNKPPNKPSAGTSFLESDISGCRSNFPLPFPPPSLPLFLLNAA